MIRLTLITKFRATGFNQLFHMCMFLSALIVQQCRLQPNTLDLDICSIYISKYFNVFPI